MKKTIWFIKDKGVMRESSVSELLELTSKHSSVKIKEHSTKTETHKIIEFTE